MKFKVSITALSTLATLVLVGCESSPEDSYEKKGDEESEFSNLKRETSEAVESADEFGKSKAEEAGITLKEAGKKVGEAVTNSVDNIKDRFDENKEPAPQKSDEEKDAIHPSKVPRDLSLVGVSFSALSLPWR